MSFLELVEQISKETGIPKTKVRKVLDSLAGVVTNTVLSGEKVKFTNFGVFELYHYKPSSDAAAWLGYMPKESKKVRFKQVRRRNGKAGSSSRGRLGEGKDGSSD